MQPGQPPPKPVATLAESARWKAQLESMPEFKAIKFQRNLAIAFAGLFAYWALFNYALYRRLLEIITTVN